MQSKDFWTWEKNESLESKLRDSADKLKHYPWRNCLLHGVWELEGKNINVIIKTVKEEMNIDISEKDLDIS